MVSIDTWRYDYLLLGAVSIITSLWLASHIIIQTLFHKKYNTADTKNNSSSNYYWRIIIAGGLIGILTVWAPIQLFLFAPQFHGINIYNDYPYILASIIISYATITVGLILSMQLKHKLPPTTTSDNYKVQPFKLYKNNTKYDLKYQLNECKIDWKSQLKSSINIKPNLSLTICLILSILSNEYLCINNINNHSNITINYIWYYSLISLILLIPLCYIASILLLNINKHTIYQLYFIILSLIIMFSQHFIINSNNTYLINTHNINKNIANDSTIIVYIIIGLIVLNLISLIYYLSKSYSNTLPSLLSYYLLQQLNKQFHNQNDQLINYQLNEIKSKNKIDQLTKIIELINFCRPIISTCTLAHILSANTEDNNNNNNNHNYYSKRKTGSKSSGNNNIDELNNNFIGLDMNNNTHTNLTNSTAPIIVQTNNFVTNNTNIVVSSADNNNNYNNGNNNVTISYGNVPGYTTKNTLNIPPKHSPYSQPLSSNNNNNLQQANLTPVNNGSSSASPNSATTATSLYFTKHNNTHTNMALSPSGSAVSDILTPQSVTGNNSNQHNFGHLNPYYNIDTGRLNILATIPASPIAATQRDTQTDYTTNNNTDTEGKSQANQLEEKERTLHQRRTSKRPSMFSFNTDGEVKLSEHEQQFFEQIQQFQIEAQAEEEAKRRANPELFNNTSSTIESKVSDTSDPNNPTGDQIDLTIKSTGNSNLYNSIESKDINVVGNATVARNNNANGFNKETGEHHLRVRSSNGILLNPPNSNNINDASPRTPVSGEESPSPNTAEDYKEANPNNPNASSIPGRTRRHVRRTSTQYHQPRLSTAPQLQPAPVKRAQSVRLTKRPSGKPQSTTQPKVEKKEQSPEHARLADLAQSKREKRYSIKSIGDMEATTYTTDSAQPTPAHHLHRPQQLHIQPTPSHRVRPHNKSASPDTIKPLTEPFSPNSQNKQGNHGIITGGVPFTNTANSTNSSIQVYPADDTFIIGNTKNEEDMMKLCMNLHALRTLELNSSSVNLNSPSNIESKNQSTNNNNTNQSINYNIINNYVALANSVPLSAVLSNPASLELFKDSVMRDQNLETLQFYLSIQRLKQLNSRQALIVFAHELRQMFVANDSAYPVPLTAATKEKIEFWCMDSIRLLSQSTPTNNSTGNAGFGSLGSPVPVFKIAEIELYYILDTYNYPSFKQSEAFRLCLFILGLWPNNSGNNNQEYSKSKPFNNNANNTNELPNAVTININPPSNNNNNNNNSNNNNIDNRNNISTNGKSKIPSLTNLANTTSNDNGNPSVAALMNHKSSSENATNINGNADIVIPQVQYAEISKFYTSTGTATYTYTGTDLSANTQTGARLTQYVSGAAHNPSIIHSRASLLTYNFKPPQLSTLQSAVSGGISPSAMNLNNNNINNNNTFPVNNSNTATPTGAFANMVLNNSATSSLKIPKPNNNGSISTNNANMPSASHFLNTLPGIASASVSPSSASVMKKIQQQQQHSPPLQYQQVSSNYTDSNIVASPRSNNTNNNNINTFTSKPPEEQKSLS